MKFALSSFLLMWTCGWVQPHPFFFVSDWQFITAIPAGSTNYRFTLLHGVRIGLDYPGYSLAVCGVIPWMILLQKTIILSSYISY